VLISVAVFQQLAMEQQWFGVVRSSRVGMATTRDTRKKQYSEKLKSAEKVEAKRKWAPV
jgi:hypothetical protein